MNLIPLLVFVWGLLGCSDDNNEPALTETVACSPEQFQVACEGGSFSIQVNANREWAAYSNDSWISCSPGGSIEQQGTVTVVVKENGNSDKRTGSVVVKAGRVRSVITIEQEAAPQPEEPEIEAPEGYELVWNDEFNAGDAPDLLKWKYETGHGDSGWGNNEIQNYVAGSKDGVDCAVVSDGTLKIILQEIGDEVCSIRMNTRANWKYGWFEARLKLPKGKGTWPAFWMLPDPFTSWPAGGEIDIMEEVGYDPNRVHSTIHCGAYNGSNGQQKGGNSLIATSQTDFHVYAAEWTETYIRFFIDGQEHFRYDNDGTGNNATWPFDTSFNLKLNLAWGGNWGGGQGLDESCLPATYEIDYVRVFQKK